VKQYRCAVQTRLWEFPAGTVEPHEDPGETIKRELIEEAGYEAQSWQNLGKFPLCPGYSDEYIYAYLAQDLVKLPATAHEADEDMEVVLMDREEFIAAIASGLMDAKTICSFWLAQPFLQ
jgi:ADP-ribose pyrophosphatase